jgi:tetratricopeptide (TPR) repeat protein
MFDKFKNIIMVFFIIFVFCLFTNSDINAQPKLHPLRGDQIVDQLESQGITPQKAHNGIKSFENLLQGGSMVNNEPQILYTIAKYKIYLGYKHKEIDYVVKNPDEYEFYEPAGIYLYKGQELIDIMEIYPASPIVDDAAFMYCTMKRYDHCKDNNICMITKKIEAYKPLLENYHRSPFLYNAILDINEAMFPLDAEFANEIIAEEKADLLEALDMYHHMLEKVKNKDRVHALATLALTYKNLGQNNKAKLIYTDILQNYPEYEGITSVKKEMTTME